MKQLLFVILATLLCCTTSWAQPASLQIARDEGPTTTSAAVELARTITPEDLTTHLTVLASDEFEGRETGTPGMEKAAAYIAAHFEKLGLPKVGENDSYFQSIAYTAENWETIDLSQGDTEYRHLWDYYAFPSVNSSREAKTYEEIIFLGYGIEAENYNEYKGENVEGKAVMIYAGEPVDENGISQVTGTTELSEWSTDYRKKLEAAYKNGVSTLLIIDPDIKKSIAEQRRLMLSPQFRIGLGEDPESRYANSVFISSTMAKELMGNSYKKVIKTRDKMKSNGKIRSVKLKNAFTLVQEKRVRQILGYNVLGLIEGTDPQLKDEMIILTAHFDHLGKRGDDIYNGADDNGSGTSTVLEIAEALTIAKEKGMGPRRSVLCMLVSGEEKGLLGSRYYVENPIFPLENTVANVNVDMVGRVDDKHADNPEYIYVIGSDRLSTELHQINETANNTHTRLELDYTYNAEDDPNRYYYRSDHYNFAERGIPAIFYFSGTHADYHQITDTVEKINFDKMAKVGGLVFHVVWELSNRDRRIEVDVPQD